MRLMEAIEADGGQKGRGLESPYLEAFVLGDPPAPDEVGD